jgi:DUF1680 family protein
MRTWIVGLGLLAGVAAANDYPFQPVPFTAVHVQDGFWSPRIETNRQTTVWYDFQKCEETGRIDNFAKAGKLMPGEFRGTPFDDSDVFKVIEGAAYSLALQPDPKLDKYLDDLIVKIAAAQEPDGYLYSARTIDPKKREKFHGPTRWSNLGTSHELYNVGHLYEGAVAHYQATGKKTLLNVALKNADMLCATFGPGKVQEPPGHQEIEIGLCKLYRVTGQQKYLDLAKYYVELRGREGTHKLRGPSQQDHKPITEQDEAVGHAVRAAYYYSGVADVAALTGDAKLIAAIDRLWDNVAGKKLYLTGGIGARHAGEAFGENYELPNATAYNETCAAIANALWNQRMFLLHGEAKYAHVLEHILYNGFLSGVALTGDAFFYPNPLESRAGYKRSPWFGCSCCPVNVVRMVPSVPGYVYATRGDALFVNLFIGGTAKVQLGGQTVTLTQTGDYPWDGKIKLIVAPEKEMPFALKLRIPGWARNEPLPGGLYRYADAQPENWSVKINGAPQSFQGLENGYAVISKAWKTGDVVELELPMPVRRVLALDEVKADRNRFAVMRGPIVFCAEGADNGGKVLDKKFPGAVQFAVKRQPDLFGGVVTLRMTQSDQLDALTLIPYCMWENRGPNEMAAWFRTVITPEPWAASFCHDADSVEACFDGQLPKNSNDHKIPRMTWWDHKGTAEWVERTFEKPTQFSSSDVYWFDDTGKGACRVPQSWKLLYKSGNDWKPVEPAGDYGVAKDKFNAVTFKPVTTTALRLEVQLQPKVSGGILEWRMK